MNNKQIVRGVMVFGLLLVSLGGQKSLFSGQTFTQQKKVVITDVSVLSEVEREVVGRPFTTKISDDGKRADMRSYCAESHGIADIGHLRIAVQDLKFDGSGSVASVVLAPSQKPHPDEKSFTATGRGDKKFTCESAPGKTMCSFAGIEFYFAEGKLVMDGETIPIDKPTTVFLSRKGEIQKIVQVDPSVKPKEKK